MKISNGVKKLLILLLFLLLPLNLAKAESPSLKLKGRILLQVEANGEAWYVNPISQNRFYLGRPADAFRVMREQGLGISNKDFDSFKGAAPVRLAGRILLKVEDSGKAYYVNSVDLKMHYLGRPADAFNVMKNMGLGITDSNLALIAVDEKSSPVITEEMINQNNPEEQKPDEVAAPESDTVATSTDSNATEETATTTEEVVVDDTASSTCVWLVEYFDHSRPTGDPLATSSANEINFDWGLEGPSQLSVINNFSLRLTANCNFLEGNYEFKTVFDDAIRVYFDGELFLWSWADNDREMLRNSERSITEGRHEVKVEYYEAARYAKVKVSWEKLN